MKAIGIVASPRVKGNTSEAVAWALEGAGCESRVFDMNGIEPCHSCFSCKKTQRCAIKDDMQQIYEALEGADLLVLGSPIYLDHVSAQAWIFINRMYAWLGPAVENMWRGPRHLLLVATQALAGIDTYRHPMDQVADIFKSYWDVESIPHLIIGGCPRYGGIGNRTDARDEALAAGRRLMEAASR